MTWHEAKTYCEGRGAYLATVTSQQEEDFVYDKLCCSSSYECWLGGTDESGEGNWLWITGEEWKYTHWGNGEPNTYCAGENYLHLFRIAGIPGYWNDEIYNGQCGRGVGKVFVPICEWSGCDNTTCYTKEQLDQAVKTEQLKWDANGDGKIAAILILIFFTETMSVSN